MSTECDQPVWRKYVMTFFFTLSNPMTIISFMAIFAGLGLMTGAKDSVHALLLVLGVIMGSFLWWFTLSSGVVYTLRGRMTPKIAKIINKASGIIILLFGFTSIALVNS